MSRDVAGLVRDLETAARDLQGAERRLSRDVAEARLRGLSWGQIGAALGVSRQAAHQRFASIRTSREDRPLPGVGL